MYKKTSHRIYKGFTLVELLITISLVSIFSVFIISVINPVRLRMRVRDAQRKKDLEIISLGLEQYYADHNAYPNTNFSGLAAILSPLSGTTYLKTTPNDPLGQPANSYCYTPSGGTQNFVMCSILESDIVDNISADLLTPFCVTTPDADTSATLGRHCVTNPL